MTDPWMARLRDLAEGQDPNIALTCSRAVSEIERLRARIAELEPDPPPFPPVQRLHEPDVFGCDFYRT